jgi:hypothetical protein
MFFGLITQKISCNMKKLTFFIAIAVVIASCASSKETTATKNETRQSKKLAAEELIKKAVESRRYIIKIDRLYMSRGGAVDLKPSSNFVIINGGIASVSLYYSGPSSFSRPISAINFNGRTITYEMKNDQGKGVYNINTRVNKGADNFDFYITIGTSGSCSLSVVNPHIQSVTYKGEVMPIPAEGAPIPEDPKRIL